MTTTEAINSILPFIEDDALLVSSLGRTAETVFNTISDRNRVLFLDCMGAVTGVGVGLALSLKNNRVYAFETDGSFMYNITILNTISSRINSLSNFCLLIFDNGILESGGGWKSYSDRFNWGLLAKAWALEFSILENADQLSELFKTSTTLPKLAVIKINNNNIHSTCNKDIDGIESKYRFRRFINDNIQKGIIRPCIKN